MSALRSIVLSHSLRAVLLASYRASVRNDVALNAASTAGKALADHEDARAAGRSIAGDDWESVQARGYCVAVALEERGERGRAAISDEDSR